MLQLAVFVSGRGSNLRSIHMAIKERRLTAEIVAVVTNLDSAPARSFAEGEGIPCLSVEGKFPDEQARVMLDFLEAQSADFIALAGYVKLIPAEVVAAFPQRMVNIHPALLPAFGGKGMYGRRVHEAVLASGVQVSGATVHLVDEEYDRGPIVMQRSVIVHSDDTVDSLAERVLDVEHTIYPEALQLFAERRVEVIDNRIFIRN
ncbi:MAG: phosphoribosylglycinamide formyltransferase [Bacteroidetes bacterium]|nr:phosphoribosylglycinamide formyltransferase [Bacteroidota bacterium]